jgi:hypothetical protein
MSTFPDRRKRSRSDIRFGTSFRHRVGSRLLDGRRWWWIATLTVFATLFHALALFGLHLVVFFGLIGGEEGVHLGFAILVDGHHLRTHIGAGESGVGAEGFHFGLLVGKDGLDLSGLVVGELELLLEHLDAAFRIHSAASRAVTAAVRLALLAGRWGRGGGCVLRGGCGEDEASAAEQHGGCATDQVLHGVPHWTCLRARPTIGGCWVQTLIVGKGSGAAQNSGSGYSPPHSTPASQERSLGAPVR